MPYVLSGRVVCSNIPRGFTIVCHTDYDIVNTTSLFRVTGTGRVHF